MLIEFESTGLIPILYDCYKFSPISTPSHFTFPLLNFPTSLLFHLSIVITSL